MKQNIGTSLASVLAFGPRGRTRSRSGGLPVVLAGVALLGAASAGWGGPLGLPLLGATQSSPLAPSKASDLVTLLTVNVPCAFPGSLGIDSRVMPDGSTATFTTPAGEILVITAAEVTVAGDASQIGHVANILLTAGEEDTNVLSSQTAILENGMPSAAAGFATKTWALGNGVTVKRGVRLCAIVEDQSLQGILSVHRAFVHGFLADDK